MGPNCKKYYILGFNQAIRPKQNICIWCFWSDENLYSGDWSFHPYLSLTRARCGRWNGAKPFEARAHNPRRVAGVLHLLWFHLLRPTFPLLRPPPPVPALPRLLSSPLLPSALHSSNSPLRPLVSLPIPSRFDLSEG